MKDYRVVIYVQNLPDDVDPKEWVDDIMTNAIDARGEQRIVAHVADVECVSGE